MPDTSIEVDTEHVGEILTYLADANSKDLEGFIRESKNYIEERGPRLFAALKRTGAYSENYLRTAHFLGAGIAAEAVGSMSPHDLTTSPEAITATWDMLNNYGIDNLKYRLNEQQNNLGAMIDGYTQAFTDPTNEAFWRSFHLTYGAVERTRYGEFMDARHPICTQYLDQIALARSAHEYCPEIFKDFTAEKLNALYHYFFVGDIEIAEDLAGWQAKLILDKPDLVIDANLAFREILNRLGFDSQQQAEILNQSADS